MVTDKNSFPLHPCFFPQAHRYIQCSEYLTLDITLRVKLDCLKADMSDKSMVGTKNRYLAHKKVN